MRKLFVDTSSHRWSTNVSVGGTFDTEYSYAIGYREAADILVDRAILLKPPTKDRLFYPICFNYRQFIELALKQLIMIAEQFYKKTEYLGYEKGTFHSDELKDTHSIEKLLNWLLDILQCVADEEFDPEIKALIIEFHNMDPTGQKFRYPISTHDIASFPIPSFFDLAKLKTGLKRISDYFSGIDGYLDYYDSLADSMIDESQAYWR